MMCELKHKNLLGAIAYGSTPPLVITELAERGSLRTILMDGNSGYTLHRGVGILSDVAQGMLFLHTRDPPLIHRDLKSGNILVTNEWNGKVRRDKTVPMTFCSSILSSRHDIISCTIPICKLTEMKRPDHPPSPSSFRLQVADFGESKAKDMGRTMTSTGTVCWMAPEILQGNKYDEKIDRYSFGICLWEIATRRDPYKKRRRKLKISEFELASRIARGGLRPHIPAAGIQPPKLLALIKQMWHQDPEQRPSFEYAHKMLEAIKSAGLRAGMKAGNDKKEALSGPVPVPGIAPAIVPAGGPGPIVGAVILSEFGRWKWLWWETAARAQNRRGRRRRQRRGESWKERRRGRDAHHLSTPNRCRSRRRRKGRLGSGNGRRGARRSPSNWATCRTEEAVGWGHTCHRQHLRGSNICA